MLMNFYSGGIFTIPHIFDFYQFSIVVSIVFLPTLIDASSSAVSSLVLNRALGKKQQCMAFTERKAMK